MRDTGGAAIAIEHTFGRAEGAAEERHGMRRDRWLADEAIQEHAEGGTEGIRMLHHLAAATSKPTVSPMTPAAPSTSPV